MKLWIRSQDKDTLMIVSNLFTEYNGSTDPTLRPYRIVTDKNISLGVYESRKRALEVLDDIQKFMNININEKLSYEEFDILIKSNMLSNITKIYNMPES